MSLLLWANAAFAVTVAIVEPLRQTAILTEIASRLHGELLSVGLDVKFIALPSHLTPNSGEKDPGLAAIAEERHLDAVIEIVGGSDAPAVDVWVLDKSGRRMIESTVVVEPDAKNPSERLAVRAVEVLRSTFLANDISLQKRPKIAAEKPTSASERQPDSVVPAKRSRSLGIELGAATLLSLDRLGPAVLALGRFDYAALPQLTLAASMAGFGLHPSVATAMGSAKVAQQLLTLGCQYRFATNPTLWPFVGASAGAIHTTVEGRAIPPNQGHGADSWSLLMDASLGTGLQLHPQYFLSVAMHLQLAEPYVAIHFKDSIVATTGRPSLALILTAGAWL